MSYSKPGLCFPTVRFSRCSDGRSFALRIASHEPLLAIRGMLLALADPLTLTPPWCSDPDFPVHALVASLARLI